MAYTRTYNTQILLSAFCLAVFLLGCECKLGLDTAGRFLYPFCHVNVYHLLANLWVLFIVARSDFKDYWYNYIIAYAICITAPASGVLTMGLSGLVYALLGQLSWQALYKWKYHAYTLAFISLGLLFPTKINNLLHIYCYAMGVGAGILVYEHRRTPSGK